MKRIFLFLMTNIAVLVVLSVTAHLLGLNRFLSAQGIDYTALLGFAALFGFGGSFISLAMSKWVAKRSVGAQVIGEPRNSAEHWLLETVRRQAEKAGIGMPEVAVYHSQDINAFATGASRNNALVAVSTGLLHHMDRDEVEAVLAHEVSHVANGDMVTLTLIQGVLNTLVIILARIIGQFVDRAIFRNERGHGIGFWVSMIVAEIVLGLLATMIVMWFSRYREFRADVGGARLAGRESMIRALDKLRRVSAGNQPLPDEMEAFGISGRVSQGLRRLFMSHPPLEERIRALAQGR